SASVPGRIIVSLKTKFCQSAALAKPVWSNTTFHRPVSGIESLENERLNKDKKTLKQSKALIIKNFRAFASCETIRFNTIIEILVHYLLSSYKLTSSSEPIFSLFYQKKTLFTHNSEKKAKLLAL